MGFTHFWSLAVEEHFYLVWPALVFFLNRRAAMLRASGVIAIAHRPAHVGRVISHQDVESTYIWTFCRMDCLAIGSLLAPGGSRLSKTVWNAFRRIAPWTFIAAAAACGAMFVAMARSRTSSRRSRRLATRSSVSARHRCW